MLLSVIVPVYNAEKYLGDCLDSLINLSLQDAEFIIVNDGSKDNSSKICIEYENKDSRIKYIKKENGGVSSARNEGLKCAKGDYILFLDSDDRLSENIIKAVELCLSHNIPMLILRRYYITRDCPEFVYDVTESIFQRLDEQLYEVKNYKQLLLTKFFCSGSAEILFKSSLLQGLLFDEKLTLLEDFNFFLSLLDMNNPKVFLYNECVTYINDEVEGSLTKKKRDVDSVKPGSIMNNSFLLKFPKLNKKIFYFEVYFHFKQLGYFDRHIYVYRHCKVLMRNISLCKYFLGSMGLLIFNVDINRIRILVNSLVKK